MLWVPENTKLVKDHWVKAQQDFVRKELPNEESMV